MSPTLEVRIGERLRFYRQAKWEHLPFLDIAISADHGRMLTMLVDALTADVTAP